MLSLDEAFICLCREVGLYRVTIASLWKTTGKEKTSSVFDHDYKIRFSVLILVTTLNRNNRMRYNFVIMECNGVERALFWAAKTLLLFHPNTQRDSSKPVYVLPYNNECIPAMNEIDKEMSCVCLRWSSTSDVEYCAVVWKNLNSRTKL